MRKKMVLIVAGLSAGMALMSSNTKVSTVYADTENSDSTTKEENNISDKLKSLVATKKGISKDEVTPEYLATLTSLDLSDSNLTDSDLSGLEYATALTDLNLSGNNITGMGNLLDNMGDLVDLNLSNNQLLNMNFMSLSGDGTGNSFENLKKLDLSGNKINKFSPLDDLDNLSPENVNIKNQKNSLGTQVLYTNDTKVDVKSIINAGSNINVTSAKMFNNNSTAKIDYADLSNVVISNITADDTFVIDLDYTYTTSNGVEYPTSMEMSQSYKVGLHDLVLKEDKVTLAQGDTWDSSQLVTGIISPNNVVTTWDSDDVKAAIEDGSLTISGVVDTSKAGTYEVVYTYTNKTFTKKKTVIVTVKAKSSGSSSSSGSGGSATSDVSMIPEKSLLTKKTDKIDIYNQNGKKVSEKVLSELTSYKTNKKNVIGDITYYEIADGQWVKASDVREYTAESGVLQTKSDSYKRLLNLNGVVISNRALAQTTDWLYSGYADFNGTKYYRVSTNEWISADDAVVFTKVNGILTVNEQAQLYNDTGSKTNRALAADSKFRTDKLATINGEKMYRVATNEWVKANEVTLN